MGVEGFQPSRWYFSDIRSHTLFVATMLLVFLIFLLLSFIFFRFICQQVQFHSSAVTDVNADANHRIAIPAPALLGLDASFIKSLPILIHRSPAACAADKGSSISFRESDCSICLGSFEDKETVKVMPDCLHAFHSECVDTWLSSRSTCPLCRASLYSSTGSVVP